jgi:hypothetical protein
MATTDTKSTSKRRDTRKLFVWLNQVKGDPELSPVAFMVAYEIGQHFNSQYGGAAWPSSLTIAINIGADKATVIRAVRRLRERGHLTVEPGRAGGPPGRGHSNRYRMSKPERNGVSAHPLEPRKGALEPRKGAPAHLNYLKPSKGDAKASPQRERESELALAVIPASAPAPVGAALEGKEVAVDRFADLWALWSAARSWPDSDVDEAAALRSFALACREARPDDIVACAHAWVSVIEPRYLSTLSKWLLGRGWNKRPPARRQRNGGKVSLSAIALEIGSQWGRS